MFSPSRTTALLSLWMAATFAGLGCLPASDEDMVAEDTSALEASENGLTMNGLTMNGLTMNGLMTTDGGRMMSKYLVRCALPEGRTIVKQDQYGSNLFDSGFCHINGCVPSDAKTNNVPDGYKACAMGEGPMSAWNETITVWRQNKTFTSAGQVVAGKTADGRTVHYDFESGVGGWTAGNTQLVLSSSNQTVAQTGGKFLKATYASGSGTIRVQSPATLALPAGTKVSFYLYLASDSKLTQINPFVKKTGGNEWKVTNPVSNVLKGSWNIVTITVPASCSGKQVGVEFQTSGAFSAYVDAVTW